MNRMPSFGPGSGMSNTCKKMLIIYGSIYVLQLILFHWLRVEAIVLLDLFPYQSDYFYIWQLVTHPFVHNPASPIAFLINLLMLYFFMNSVEYILGTKKYLKLFYISALGSMICGLAVSGISGFDKPFSGMMPSLLSTIVIFGLMNPEATILLFFVLPIKAKYISYGTVIITALTFLAKANPSGAYHMGGILFGYLYFKGPTIALNNLLGRYYKYKHQKKKKKFEVIDGGDKKKNKGPTIH